MVKHNQADGIIIGDLVYDSKDNSIYKVLSVGAFWNYPGISGHYCDLEYYGDPFDLSDSDFEGIVLSLYD